MSHDVLVVFPHHASFIDQDISLLERHFDTASFLYEKPRDRYKLPLELAGARVAIAWFVLGYAYVMTRLKPIHRAKVILIPGGWDVEALPELDYGEMRSETRQRRTSYSLRHADRVLPVSTFTKTKVNSWAPQARCEVVYHGFDDTVFAPDEGPRSGVVTVARLNRLNWNLKGLSVLAEVARRIPDVPFTLIGGVDDPSLVELFPPNTKVVGPLMREALVERYRRAHVYAQLSAVESFGCSLAESMLCGCHPVVTERGAMPEVVGEVGQIVPFGNPEATEQAVRRALASPTGPLERIRVREYFPLHKRETSLVRVIRGLLENGA